MRKRLRKKKRLGEFKEFGLLVAVTPAFPIGSPERDSLLDRFIGEAIERNDLSCGGGGGESWEFFVTANARRASVTEAQRRALEAWLHSGFDMGTFTLSPPIDAWHGKF
ncbi:MAG: YggL family protein [Acidobacteriota bacterium]|nr:YggL family protein [Acidobacteriota bacterium]